jgi:hypothetical protein
LLMNPFFCADSDFANPEVYEYLEAVASNMRSGFRLTASCRNGSAICSNDPLVSIKRRAPSLRELHVRKLVEAASSER